METLELWMVNDIATHLGLDPVTIRNWSTQGHPNLPAPYAVTPAGKKLWTVEQVAQLQAAREARAAQIAARKAARDAADQAKAKRKARNAGDKEREERFLARMIDGGFDW